MRARNGRLSKIHSCSSNRGVASTIPTLDSAPRMLLPCMILCPYRAGKYSDQEPCFPVNDVPKERPRKYVLWSSPPNQSATRAACVCDALRILRRGFGSGSARRCSIHANKVVGKRLIMHLARHSANLPVRDDFISHSSLTPRCDGGCLNYGVWRN